MWTQSQKQPPSINPPAFVYDQSGAQWPKNSTESLINHTGHSPSGWSTPSSSHNQSQQPKLHRDQSPEKMLWNNDSSSNSPKSVMTPDGSESSEVEKLDSDIIPDYYPDDGHNMSTQSSNNATDSSMLFFTAQGNSYQAVQAAFHETLAAGPQSYPQTDIYNQNYPTQPPLYNERNGQGLSQSSMVPRPDHFNVDMMTGAINYSNCPIDWTTQYTHPSSLISPSKPTVPSVSGVQESFDACWHCVLQRAKCSAGDICERCHQRSQRPNADCSLGCNRVKLVDLSPYFLPALVTQMHEDSSLTHFVTQYIQQWGSVELTVWMTCGQNHMPRIPVKVYEFVPRGDALLVQIQYKTDSTTHKRVAIQKQSPALGMVRIDHNEEKKYDKYITDIVDSRLDTFGELCWMEDDNDFQQKLFRLMTRVKPKSDDEAELLREIFRLIVVTFIMSHTLTIAEETKAATLSQMHSYGGYNSYVDNYTSPRMTNRQLKYFFSRLQRSIQTNVLNKLQQIFKSSKGCDKWLAAFVAMLGMCMALEDQQKTIHLVMSTKATTEGVDHRDAQGKAEIACREIDQRMQFLQQIFRWKYNRNCNPMRDAERDWSKEVGFGDESSVDFVRQVAQLVKENIDFLQQRQMVSISSANQTEYSSRLVAQFLLSFWLPNA